ncbi:hypothetical protein KR009_008518, partial [Drosophila setifemur]
KLREPDSVVLTPALFRSCVLDSLESFFCEERPPMDIVKFSAKQQRIIFRVPEEFYQMTRACMRHIGHYQDTPCHFQVLEASKDSLDFEKSSEKDISED